MAQKEPASKKAEKSSATEPVSTQKDSFAHEKKSRGIGHYFWGLLFVVIGVLLLLDNLGVVEVRLWNLWQLWPVFIIAAGLSILSLRGWVWNTLGAILLAMTLAAAVWVTLDTGSTLSSVETTTTSIDSAMGVEELEVSVEAGASQLRFSSHEGEQAIKAELKSSRSELIQDVEYEGTKQLISLGTESRGGWWLRGGQSNELEVSLTRALPVSLKIDSGASSVSADLSEVQLRSLKVDAGASSLDIALGDRVSETTVTVDSGLSSVKIRVPKSSGVQFVIDGGLNSRSLADLKEVGENTYETEGYSKAEKKIIIRGDLGLASITLERY